MNSQTTPITSTILRNKLGRLAIKLQQQANSKGTNINFATLEQVVCESVKVLSKFYKQLANPLYVPEEVFLDTLPDPIQYNNNFNSILEDLQTIFMEFENLEGVILGEFNYMVSRLNKLNMKLKTGSSNLADFILLSNLPTKDAIFFSDSFNSLNRIEANSPLLNKEQCEVNQSEGIITLPIDRVAQKAFQISAIPIINSNSNGIIGNNEESGATLHNNISDILDNNADTWFEYEKTSYTNTSTPLLLDLTINLGELRIINFIRINPNNFGTKTQVEILNIDTSYDGKEFVSIKDDIPLSGFAAADEKNLFILSPSTSKFAGQGLYTFTPRKAKYVRLTFKQTTPYSITTNSGAKKLRYAIGIRDIDIQALPYKPEGEIISINYLTNTDIRKLVLLSNQHPTADTVSFLASIDHFISPDNGVTWHQLRPKVSSGLADTEQEVLELLDFNGVSEHTINTNSPVRSIRYKAALKRNTEAFSSDSSELAQQIKAISELHSIPITTPFKLFLQKKPIVGTIKLIDPQFGSRGKENTKYQIATGTDKQLSILFPFKPLIRDLQKVETGAGTDVWNLRDLDPETIYVDGIAWNRGALTGTVNNYKINYEDGKITFGDGTNGNVVGAESSIAMVLTEERIFPSRAGTHITKLNYPTSNDKKQMEIYRVDPQKVGSVVLKKGATRHQLFANVVEDSIQSSDTSVLDPAAKETFIDGTVELVAGDDWSCDYTNGTLFMATATPSNSTVTLTFKYTPKTQLKDSEWNFINSNNGIANAISIMDSAFVTNKAKQLSVPSNVNYFNLREFGIVKGFVKFSITTGTLTCLIKEVAFIDGRTELLGVVQTVEQLDAVTSLPIDDIAIISLKMKITSDTSFTTVFSDTTLFIEEQVLVGDITDVGDYFIDRTANTIHIKLAAVVSDPGTITYYYANPHANLTGRYSINYGTGEVFTYSTTQATVVANYSFTNYIAKYDIARLITSDDWTYSETDNKILIKDREILKNIRTPQNTNTTNSSKFYQIVYQYIKSTRIDIDELEPYFSPVLKDYALKITTKDRLI